MSVTFTFFFLSFYRLTWQDDDNFFPHINKNRNDLGWKQNSVY